MHPAVPGFKTGLRKMHLLQQNNRRGTFAPVSTASQVPRSRRLHPTHPRLALSVGPQLGNWTSSATGWGAPPPCVLNATRRSVFQAVPGLIQPLHCSVSPCPAGTSGHTGLPVKGAGRLLARSWEGFAQRMVMQQLPCFGLEILDQITAHESRLRARWKW